MAGGWQGGTIQDLLLRSATLPSSDLPTFAGLDEREKLSPEEGEPSSQPAFARTVPAGSRYKAEWLRQRTSNVASKCTEREHKYAGKRTIIDYKYQIFSIPVDRAGIPQEALWLLFPTIAKGVQR